MKYSLRFSLLVLLCSFSFFAVRAQLLNNAYFFENLPQRHVYNPAFQPINTFYVGIPLLTNWQFNYHSDLPTLKQSGFSSGQLLSLDTHKSQIINALSSSHFLNPSISVPLLEGGFRFNRHYFTFSLTQKFEANSLLSKGFYETFLSGIDFQKPLNADFSNSSLSLSHFSEAAFGYSKLINERFTWGAKLKLIYGHSYFDATSQIGSLYSDQQGSGLNAAFQIKQSSPYSISNQFDLIQPNKLRDHLSPSGLGAAVDLGFTYKPVNPVTFAMAVTNIGAIQWRKMKQSDFSVNSSFDQQDASDWLTANPTFTEVPSDTIMAHLKRGFNVNRTNLPSQLNYLTPALNASVEVSILRNLLNLGLLSRTYYHDGKFSEDLTASVGVKFGSWMNGVLSYSVLNGGIHSFGLGASARVGIVNIFASADYVPVQYAAVNPNEYHNRLPSMRFPVGFHTDRFALSAGVNIAIGKRKDSDGDGISDRFDRCPYTPAGVKVDRFGCPIDSDGDGVPDYLDKCPNTPKEARGFVGPDGCMLDSDGDGVPDYLDKCPDTAPGAMNYVDDCGCPIDSDGDGVYDYMDRCPDTPKGIEVDEFGCPIDSDGDGVPDYLDLCPDTPAAARGYVDANGCPKDSDDDGVPDYLDLCPDTPFEARGFVDANGCPKDSDDDGVPDYLDKCPNTPFEARHTVDDCGCPRDTDGDGVPDYLDDCPTVPGPASNNGCPEIAPEIKSLLFSAIQLVRFERDSLVLQPSSYEVLDKIAGILLDNPIYHLAIHGHTDNVPRKEILLRKGLELNITAEMTQAQQDDAIKMQISEEYARLVRNYLYIRGIQFNRLHITGMSDKRPVASNNTEAGRFRNCRVEMFITFEEVRKE